MKISIITVVYNNEKTIRDALNSVFSQSYNNIEYIVIDGGSTDNTKSHIEKHTSQISKYISEKDNGIYDAMNKGISMATGDVVGILNSDDIYNDANVIQDVVAEFIRDPDLRLVYGDLVYVNAVDTDKVIRKWKSKPYFNAFFENANVPPHPALFVKKDVYDNIGLFNINYRLAADYDFMLRAFKQFGNKSKYISKLMVRMRLGGATNKNLKNIINGNKEILSSWENNGFPPPLLLMPIRIFKRLIQFI